MSLETEIARLANVLETGLGEIAAAIRQSQIGTSPLVVASPSPPVTTPEPPAKRGRPAAVAPPAPVAEPAPPPAQAASPAAPNGKGPSFDEVVAIAQELARQKTPPVAIKLINEHGAQKLADMDPAQYPAFYAAAQVALAQDTPL